MRYHNNKEIYLIDGKQLNQAIWAIEQMMDIFQENSDMLIRLGRLREALINKISYSELLDKMGIPQAPPEEEITWVEFLSELGIRPAEKKK
tara:strand:- start:1137 stop:1409 length:273 start_codon:yes stop_codon:yes gene_type:complete